MPYFDDLFAASDNVLDGLFAGPATYRASGQLLSITASVRSIGERNDGEKDVPQSWIGYVVECYAADLTISGVNLPILLRTAEHDHLAAQLQAHIVARGVPKPTQVDAAVVVTLPPESVVWATTE